MVKNPCASARDSGLIPEPGRSPGVGNGNPLQYSCLENPMDREAWLATVHGVATSRTCLRAYTTTTREALDTYEHLPEISSLTKAESLEDNLKKT